MIIPKYTDGRQMSKQNVYAIYDLQENDLQQFAAPETVLAKDAVLAYVQERAHALFGTEGADGEEFKSFMTYVSQTGSVEELQNILSTYEFKLSILQIGN